MDCFKKIITNYDYADRLKPGGFVIDGKPALKPHLTGRGAMLWHQAANIDSGYEKQSGIWEKKA